MAKMLQYTVDSRSAQFTITKEREKKIITIVQCDFSS